MSMPVQSLQCHQQATSISEELSMRHFIDDERGYRAWVSSHPNGLVFKPKRAGQFVVHLAHCTHIAWFGPRDHSSGEWRYSQGRGKWCFEERKAAVAWVAAQGARTEDCRSCAPAFSARLTIPPQPTVAHPQPERGVVRVGSLVEVEDEEGGRFVYRVGSGSLPPGGRILNAETPVARTLLGRRAGDIVEISTSGDHYRLQIIGVEDPPE